MPREPTRRNESLPALASANLPVCGSIGNCGHSHLMCAPPELYTFAEPLPERNGNILSDQSVAENGQKLAKTSPSAPQS